MSREPHDREDEREWDDDHPLAPYADAVLDGTPVDWTTTPRAVIHGDGLVRQLQVLASLAEIHRAPVGDAAHKTPAALWGPFQLLERVGHGAFGDVFRAWDPRLSKEVAVKLLNEPESREPEQRHWVIHEARCLAAVRHPNVVTVHGADRVDGRVGFWTEFIHGLTLEALVAGRGPLEVDEAIAIGVELCRAVAAVHRAGLLHRDIKASNVMREAGGRIVLLDFGTSKNVASRAGVGSRDAHVTGVTGTPLYLAPELWRGASATPQSDLYSVAVVLYFLVTGSYPVRGTTVRDLADAHDRRRSTSLLQARPDVPSAFAAVLQRALDPTASVRFEDADAFEAALLAVQPAAGVERSSHRLSGGAFLAIGGMAAIAAVLIGLAWIPRPVAPPVAREVVTPDGQLGHPSRDGRFYPWVTNDARADIEVWELATGQSHVVARHDDAFGGGVGWQDGLTTDNGLIPQYQFSATAMSPTGERVAYTWKTGPNEFSMRLVNTDGTLDRVLLESRASYEPVPVDWSADGTQILCWFLNANHTADLVLVSADDGTRQILTTKTTEGIPGTTLAPDGRSAIFERVATSGRRELVRVSLGHSDPTHVLQTAGDEMSPIWVDPSHLFFARPSPTLQYAFDGWMMGGVAGVPKGDPVKLVSNLAGETNFVVTGHTSVQLNTQQDWHEVYTATLDLTGRQPPTAPVRIVPSRINGHLSPSWSPDGREIAFYDTDPSGVIAVKDTPILAIKDVATNEVRRLHPNLHLDRYWPRWTADGKNVRVYGRVDPDGKTIGWYSVNVATSESHPILLDFSPLAAFLPDGDSMVYADVDDDHPRGVVLRQLSTGHEQVIVPTVPDRPLGRFALSADGRYLAYVHFAQDHGRRTMSLIVQSIRGGARQTLLTVTAPDGLELHSWTPDGRHILFTRGHGSRQPLWLASLDGGLVDMHFTVQTRSSPVFVHPDGRQIVYAEKITAEVLWTRPLPLEPERPAPQRR